MSALAEAGLAVEAFRPSARRAPSFLLVGGVLVGLALACALFSERLAPYSHTQFHVDERLIGPGRFLLGTDEYGRDVLSRVIIGSRISLAYGLGAAALNLLLGVPLGLWCGYVGGRVDELAMRGLDLFLSIPPLMLGLLILTVARPSLPLTIFAIGIISTPSVVRITRSATLALRQEEFVEAARAAGESGWWIVAFEILPNAWPVIVVEGSYKVTSGMLLGAALSFLGLGTQPPESDWGLMISEARSFIVSAPWIALAPGITMCLTAMGFNLLGAGLRDVLDPRLLEGGR